MVQALIDGERDPEVLADLAGQKLRLRHDALVEALTGRLNGHHAFRCAVILRLLDELSVLAGEVTSRIGTVLAPFSLTRSGTW